MRGGISPSGKHTSKRVLRMTKVAKQEPVPSYDYPIHPAAEAFPLNIESDEFRALKDDMSENGQRESIVLDAEGRLLDGRHRLEACKQLGIKPKTTVYDGDALAYVVSTNMHRRHLSPEQRVAAAAMIANLRRGQSKTSVDDATTQDEAAKRFGVSSRAIRIAKGAADKAGNDVLHLMRDGKITGRGAERLAVLDAKKRNAFLLRFKEAPDEAALKSVRRDVDAAYKPIAEAAAEKKHDERVNKVRAEAKKLGLPVGNASDDDRSSWDARWSEPIELLTSLGGIDFDALLRDEPLSVQQRQELDGLITRVRAALEVVMSVEEIEQRVAA